MKNNIAIIILNYNGFEDTIECVNSILEYVPNNTEIIIVDNCSLNDSFFQLENQKLSNNKWREVHLIKTDENRGFSAGNNFGIKYAQKQFCSSYFWILNNDTVIKNDALTPLINKYEENEKIGILGSTLLFYDTPQVIQAVGGQFFKYYGKFKQVGFNIEEDVFKFSDNLELDYVIGASLFVSEDFLNKVGLLSEDYFLFYEEVDWSIRSKQLGFVSDYCKESRVFHKQGRSTGNKARGKRNIKIMYYQFKNLILIYKKFYPQLLAIPYLVVTYRCFKLAMKQDYSFIKLWKQVVFKKRINYFE